MSNNSSAEAISLPQGGGALSGIGEKFSPDLFTGTGNFTVPIALPPGRNGFQPQLNLVYSTGNGNGSFGLGWNLSIPGVSRKTSDGVPLYNEGAQHLKPTERRDVFILSGAEDLVPVSGSYPGEVIYRPRTEGLFASIIHCQTPDPDLRNYWRVESKDGLVSFYGSPEQAGRDPAVLTKPDDPRRIFAWKLTETRDPFGNLIRYEYERDAGERGNQLLLKRIQYVDYGDPADGKFLTYVEFTYENRPDSFSDYRAGFEIRTTRRCTAINVSTHTEDGDEHPVREYRFTYATDPYNGVSLLQQLDIIGFDDAKNPYEDDANGTYPKQLPALTFGYTQFEPEQRRFAIVEGRDLPARALGAADMDLVDLHGSGLPDILEMNGTVRYWRNLGSGRFDLPRPMRAAPPYTLADPGVQMIDANGDGRMDMLVTSGPLAGYYPLSHHATWDRESFQPYQQIPSFNLDDPDVRLIDVDGDGHTDVLRSGSRIECFFNHPDRRLAWQRTDFAPRQTLDAFPNVNFSDPRVKFADMTGDNLQDIVLVHNGNVEYWPNLGHNRWGDRLSMRHAPRFPFGYDPRRILVGDVDGDGLADIVYVDRDQVMLWLNHSGNAWSEAPIIISGTPPVTDVDNLRLVDLDGTGVSGVLWSSDATGLNRNRLMFLDFTGGQKPYVLNEMNNHMGAINRVAYQPSTHYYLEDQKKPATRWRTPLLFPVQVVARVEVIDEISKSKLTTEYRYHHGYWDGAEREFRGFGMVEQLDSEVFDDYHAPGLQGDTNRFKSVLDQHFSPPILTKTWFHQGPVGEEYGDWEEVDYTDEYWPEDPQLLDHTGQVNAFLSGYSDRGANRMPSPNNRRIKRDALRVLRGSILRTELYALDGSNRASRPYTVTEHAYRLREEPYPAAATEGNSHIFFPHLIAQRTTQWERGDDPLTQFAFTDDYDEFGQPRQQTSAVMPRRASKQLTITAAVAGTVQPDETKVLATHTRTTYATTSVDRYMHDRVAQTKAYELITLPNAPDAPDDDLLTVLSQQWQSAQQVRDSFSVQQPVTLRVSSHTVNHYDGDAFEGLSVGELGNYGALVRSEALVLTEEIIRDAYGDPGNERRPGYLNGDSAEPDAPPDFGTRTGYRRVNASAEGYLDGWYVDTQRQQFDFQAGTANPRGLVLAMRDALGNETRIVEYEYQLLPTRVRDAAGMETTADYNYRILQPARMTDPNGTRTQMVYSPIGLPLKQFVRGTDAEGNETLGGTEEKPEIAFLYDFLQFEREGKPVFVHTQRRIHHASDNLSDDTIESREFSDGYGRLIQTRAQAEEWIFDETGDDVDLPAQPGADPSPAIAQRVADRVVVSGWQVFDNKGRVIEKYEPFFAQGWDFEAERDAMRGQHATMFYDPRGNVIRTLNPDGSQQRVILGRPQNSLDLALDADDLTSLDVPDSFDPTPWETYTYDANDLAPLCVAPDGASLTARAPNTHHFTPASGLIDALGRVLGQVQRNGSAPGNDWFITRTAYDLRGNALQIIDAHDRDAFKHSFDLLNRPLRVDSIDAGLRTSVLDAQGNLIEYRDSKGSLARRTYDGLNRPRELWARNNTDGRFTLRERIRYGDDGDHTLARLQNTLGKPVQHYDEAGLLETPEYDFKGNLLEKSRRTIRDDALANGWQAEWENRNAEAALEDTAYQTSSRYDALNRPTEVTYPQDVEGDRKQLIPRYNRAGALEAVALDAADYVQRIAYNAKGQRVLIAYGNGIMTRHAYDEQTFRLARLLTEGFTLSEDGANTQTWRGNGPLLQDFSYRYDLAGNITQIDEQTPNCGITNSQRGRDRLLRDFSYDPIYRLLSATGRASNTIGVPRPSTDDPRGGFYTGGSATPNQDNAPDLTEGYTETFTYDPAGNMLVLSYQSASGNWNRVFGMADLPNDRWQEALNNRLTSLQNGSVTQSYQFDANGNLIQQNTERHHTWDHADRMIGYRVQANEASPPSIAARYLYGADGMRVKKWVLNQQGQVNTTVYVDGAFEHHRQGDGAENNTLHVMDNQSRIALVRVGATLDGRDASPQVQYHLGDHLGSSHVVVGGGNATGNSFINREEYFPYGETSFGSFGKKRYRYSGKERDEESGLCYYGARFLAPWMGIWVSSDPAGMIDGTNLYCFSRNNPVSLSDSSGRQSKEASAPQTDNVVDFDEGASIQGAPMDMAKALQASREAQDLGLYDEAKEYFQLFKRLSLEQRNQHAMEWASFAVVTAGAAGAATLFNGIPAMLLSIAMGVESDEQADLSGVLLGSKSPAKPKLLGETFKRVGEVTSKSKKLLSGTADIIEEGSELYPKNRRSVGSAANKQLEPVGDLKKRDKKWLEKQGIHPHQVKEAGDLKKDMSRYDIYEDAEGKLFAIPKKGKSASLSEGLEPIYLGPKHWFK